MVPEAVVWATGHRHDDHWVQISTTLNEHGALTTDAGHTPAPDLYTLDRPWQNDRGSALLGFADARRMVTELPHHTPRRLRPPQSNLH